MKLLSQYVMVADRGRQSRIAFKALADVASKAVTLAITVAAARRLNADPFGILAFGMIPPTCIPNQRAEPSCRTFVQNDRGERPCRTTVPNDRSERSCRTFVPNVR